jgi:hypothetical protein
VLSPWTRGQTLPSSEGPIVGPFLGLLLLSLPLLGLARSLLGNEPLPSFTPVLASLLQSGALLGLHRGEPYNRGLTRIGFHLGMAGFFLSYPILSPSNAAADAPAHARDVADFCLLLTVLGFELAYLVSRPRRLHIRGTVVLTPRVAQRLMVLTFFGLAAWFLTILDYAFSWQVPVLNVLLSMRGRIEGATQDAATFFGYWRFFLASGTALAGTAAATLVCSMPTTSRIRRFVAWIVLCTCAAIGFLHGSRAVFLYAVVPVSVALWTIVGRRPRRPLVRTALCVVGVTVVVLLWGAMSAMRDGDVREYEGGWEAMRPSRHVEGAFNLYWAMVDIVEAFPKTYPYEHGRSLIPLILGWVPRSIWPGKPYPFSEFETYIRGQTLEQRDASIAVGLSGEGYGNFGLAGALLWGALLGFGCARMDGAILSARLASAVRLQLAGLTAVWAAMMVRGGVPEMFYMGLGALIGPMALAYLVNQWAEDPRVVKAD